jgi:hypothetical protein
VGAGERVDEAGRVRRSLQGEGGELQAGNPAPGPVLEGGDGLRREVEAPHVLQEDGSLLGGEPQVGGAELAELPPGSQPSQRQGRVGAGGDHQVKLSGQAAEQEGDRLVDRLGLHQVVVVKDQTELVGQDGHLVDQGRHHRLGGRSGRAGEQRQDLVADAGMHPVQGRDGVPPEPRGVVVVGVQR